MPDEPDTDVERPWASQTPTTRIKGVPTDIFASDSWDGRDEQTQSSYGIVLRDAEVVIGDAYVNGMKPDGDVTRSIVDEDSTSPTDYRIADADDPSMTVVNDVLATDEESTVDGNVANQYEKGTIEDDEILLWVNGLSGERIIRHLDFNGRPYAKYTENGPVYGLFQAYDEWFADDADRGQLASDGKAPRLARPPLLRPDVGEDGLVAEYAEDTTDNAVLIDLTADDGGKYRSYRGHVFDADAFADEFGDLTTPTDEIPTGRYGLETDSELDLRMADYDVANAVIDAADWNMATFFYEGDGWGSVPDSRQQSSGSSMTVATSADTADTPSDEQQDDVAVEQIVEALEGNEALHGQTPDEALEGGLSGFIDANADEWDTPPHGERKDAIERRIYEAVDWLSVDSLEA
jgi:hypothetical protein